MDKILQFRSNTTEEKNTNEQKAKSTDSSSSHINSRTPKRAGISQRKEENSQSPTKKQRIVSLEKPALNSTCSKPHMGLQTKANTDTPSVSEHECQSCESMIPSSEVMCNSCKADMLLSVDQQLKEQNSDEMLMSKLETRLRQFASDLSSTQKKEMEDILQNDVLVVRQVLRELRCKNVKVQCKNNQKSKQEVVLQCIQQSVDLIKDMQQEGEKGEAEAADWVLMQFYEAFSKGSSRVSRMNSPVYRRTYADHLPKVPSKAKGTMPSLLRNSWITPSKLSVKRSKIFLKGNSPSAASNLTAESPGNEQDLVCQGSRVICSRKPSPSRSSSISSKEKSDLEKITKRGCQLENITASSMYNEDGSRILLPLMPRNIFETPCIMKNGQFDIELCWDFDVVSFAGRPDVGNLPLVVMGNYIITHMGLDVLLNLDMIRVNNYLRCVEDSYLDNPYHNHVHGADVMCNTYYWFTSKLFMQNMSPLDLLTTLMAAAAHDVGHDATNNHYHVMTRSKIGTRYNDKSPLENYHASLAFKILYEEDNNWMGSMQLEVQCYIRSLMIGLILATDASTHQKQKLNIITFVNSVETDFPVVLRALSTEGKLCAETEMKEDQRSRISNEPCEKIMVLKAGLHIADIANPAKPIDICVHWAKKITQEFFEQGDKERARGLKVSPLMDRKTSKIADGQKGFIKFVVKPIFELWVKLVPEAQVGLDHMEKNLTFWDEYIDECINKECTDKECIKGTNQNENVKKKKIKNICTSVILSKSEEAKVTL